MLIASFLVSSSRETFVEGNRRFGGHEYRRISHHMGHLTRHPMGHRMGMYDISRDAR